MADGAVGVLIYGKILESYYYSVIIHLYGYLCFRYAHRTTTSCIARERGSKTRVNGAILTRLPIGNNSNFGHI